MSDSTLELLKELTETNGIPGYEAPVRAVVRKHLEPLGELSRRPESDACRTHG
jgi:putative aminopeptidase FrvX